MKRSMSCGDFCAAALRKPAASSRSEKISSYLSYRSISLICILINNPDSAPVLLWTCQFLTEAKAIMRSYPGSLLSRQRAILPRRSPNVQDRRNGRAPARVPRGVRGGWLPAILLIVGRYFGQYIRIGASGTCTYHFQIIHRFSGDILFVGSFGSHQYYIRIPDQADIHPKAFVGVFLTQCGVGISFLLK